MLFLPIYLLFYNLTILSYGFLALILLYFTVFSSIGQLITFFAIVTLSHLWKRTYYLTGVGIRLQLKILKSQKTKIMVLTVSTPLSRIVKLNFLNLSLTVNLLCRFCRTVSWFYQVSLYIYEKKWAYALIWADGWWLSRLWKQFFSKKKIIYLFNICSFLSFCYLVSFITVHIWHYCWH